MKKKEKKIYFEIPKIKAVKEVDNGNIHAECASAAADAKVKRHLTIYNISSRTGIIFFSRRVMVHGDEHHVTAQNTISLFFQGNNIRIVPAFVPCNI
jgi:hypothetical protein